MGYTNPMSLDIISLQNERVKYVVKLREKRQRARDGVMLVEGQYELEMALASGLRPREVFYCEEFSSTDHLNLPVRPLTVSQIVFEKMSYRDNPDGWLAIFPTPHHTLASFGASGTFASSVPALFVLAESVEKPGNLGAILRSADAAGVDGLLVCDPRTDIYNPNVVRASRGTLFTVPVVETSSSEALAFLHAHSIQVLAATPHTEHLYCNVDLCQPVCIAVGTEDEGLSDFWMDNADLKVKIPMLGKVNSLNVSTSTAIILYEVIRQRSK
jgi:RNA methyltransferase, TrmH family